MRNLMLIGVIACVVQLRADAPPSIEGRWYGVAGPDEDRVAIGLDIRRDANVGLKAYLFQPVINFYGLDIGAVKTDGNHYDIPDYVIALEMKDGRLQGTFSALKYPMTLERTTTLPEEVPVPDLPKGPGPRWQIKLASAIWAPVAIREGFAYVGTTGGIFHAVNLADGKVAWTFNAGRPMYGEALTTADAVFFACDNGYLFKVDRKTGKEIWRYDLGDGRVNRVMPHPTVYEWDFKGAKPALADGVIFVGAAEGSFHAVDAASGHRVWRFAPAPKTSTITVGGVAQSNTGKVRTDSVIDGPRVLFGSFDGNVYALDRKSGAVAWVRDTRARVDGSPVIVGDKVIVGNFGGLLAALSANDGAVLWKRVWWGSAQPSTTTVHEGIGYIGASDLRRITAFEPATGRVLWRTDVYGWPWGRPAVTDDFIYVGVAGGSPYDMRHVPSFTAIDRKTGAIAWRWPVAESGFIYGFATGPALDGNTAVIGALDGTLYAFPAR